MHTGRLLVLVETLRNIPSKKFNFASWVGGWNWRLSQLENIKELLNPECGTTACALGHACVIPAFMELGLGLDRQGEPIFDGRYGTDAAALFFDISKTEAFFLFHWNRTLATNLDWKSPDENALATEVADHIEKFVAFKLSQTELSND